MSATTNLARPLDVLTSEDAAVLGGTPGVARQPTTPADDVRRAAVACRRCGQPIVVRWAEVVSSHRTSEGTVAYVRCRCGGMGISLPTR